MAGLVLLAACGGGDGAPSAATVGEVSSNSTTTTSAATTTTTSPEAAVEQAFYEQWDAFIEILSDPDPANPLIDRYFTGPAKEQVLDVVSRFVAENVVARRPKNPELFRPSILRVELTTSNEAEVVECTIDGLVQVDAESGEILNDEVSNEHLLNRFVLIDGYWKVRSTVDAKESDGSCEF